MGIFGKVSANISWEGLLVNGKGDGWWKEGDIFHGRLQEFRVLYAKCHNQYRSGAAGRHGICVRLSDSWRSTAKVEVK